MGDGKNGFLVFGSHQKSPLSGREYGLAMGEPTIEQSGQYAQVSSEMAPKGPAKRRQLLAEWASASGQKQSIAS